MQSLMVLKGISGSRINVNLSKICYFTKRLCCAFSMEKMCLKLKNRDLFIKLEFNFLNSLNFFFLYIYSNYLRNLYFRFGTLGTCWGTYVGMRLR